MLQKLLNQFETMITKSLIINCIIVSMCYGLFMSIAQSWHDFCIFLYTVPYNKACLKYIAYHNLTSSTSLWETFGIWKIKNGI